MSASSNKYLFGGTATLPIHIEGEIKLDSSPALFLPEYGDKIKELFYVDALLVIDDELGNKAFLGMVKDNPESLNYKMHATKRWFKQRLVPSDTNEPYIVMNDAGLNTKGFVFPDMEVLNEAVGEISVKATFKSSYFNDTTKIAIGWKSGGLKEGVIETDYYMPMGTQQSLTRNVNTYTEVPAGTTLNVYATITNEEGTYTSPYLATFKVKPAIWDAKFNATWPSLAYNHGNTVNIYSEFGNPSVGSKIFDGNNPISGSNVTPGYYVVGEKWYKVEVNAQYDFTYIERSGECTPTGWPAGDPGRPVEGSDPFNIYFNADTRNVLCQGSGEYRTIYKKRSDNRYYSNHSLSAYVEYGYYLFPGEGSFTYRSTGNGLMTLKTSCSTSGGNV